MNQEQNEGAATVVETSAEAAPLSTVVVVAKPGADVEQAEQGDGADGQAATLATGDTPPVDGQVTLRADIQRLDRARELREVHGSQVTGMPYIEPGSIERFADTDGRTMAIAVSLGELVKVQVED